MKLFDIYKRRQGEDIIQIESFATHMGRHDNMVIVFKHIINSENMQGSCPSFNGYGSEEEIEYEYELLVPQEKLNDYETWNEIFALVKE